MYVKVGEGIQRFPRESIVVMFKLYGGTACARDILNGRLLRLNILLKRAAKTKKQKKKNKKQNGRPENFPHPISSMSLRRRICFCCDVMRRVVLLFFIIIFSNHLRVLVERTK